MRRSGNFSTPSLCKQTRTRLHSRWIGTVTLTGLVALRRCEGHGPCVDGPTYAHVLGRRKKMYPSTSQRNREALVTGYGAERRIVEEFLDAEALRLDVISAT